MKNPTDSAAMTRRTFAQAAAAALLSAATADSVAGAETFDFTPLRHRHLNIGILIYPRMDQIDFTGPFEVLARIPDATVHVIGREGGQVKDHKGLTLTPDVALANAPELDVLQVPGGPGQEALMQDEAVLGFIRNHWSAGKPVFSVCTGALLCGAAGILRGRRATTHWSAFGLLKYFGAIPVDSRVVVDGRLVSAAGVTAGLDGAFRLASLLRSDQIAEEIQLDIQYAPQPPFHAGTPDTAPRAVLDAVNARYRPLATARMATARKLAEKLGIRVT